MLRAWNENLGGGGSLCCPQPGDLGSPRMAPLDWGRRLDMQLGLGDSLVF